MPISYTCPHCGTQMEVDQQYAGQRGPCAVCAKQISIPFPEGTQPSSPAKDAEEPKLYNSPKIKSKISVGSILLILGLTFGGVIMVSICGGVFYRFGLPAIRQASVTAKNQNSLDNLKIIYQAMESYHLEHGSYPPPYVPDETGKPMHSWRVLLLPHLGQQAVYDQYNFDEPWDSSQNLNLLRQMPRVYQSFDSTNQYLGKTRFTVIVGNNTMFPPGKSVRQRDISDDPQTVLMVVEVNGAEIDWIDPTKDIKRSSTTMMVTNDPDNALSLPNTLSGNALMANGDVHTLPDDAGSQLMQDMSTINGGESVIEDLDLLINFGY